MTKAEKNDKAHNPKSYGIGLVLSFTYNHKKNC